jgi:RNA polymerase sigma factor (sigma-70 family)
MITKYRHADLHEEVRTLFDTGTTGGLSDGELLGRLSERPTRDDAAKPAFAALVERHGPMVMRVCRSILRDEHDAQDAFQATFLVLVRKADSVRQHYSVGSWLHGVALRVAAHARAGMARRRRHERRAGEMTVTADHSSSQGISPELATILHEELGRLPDRYRAAIVLCYLESHSCEAAARHLGCAVGTIKSRLARGRERLRGQLVRRGIVPHETSDSVTAFPMGGLLAADACDISRALVHKTVEAMLHVNEGVPIAGLVSAASLLGTHQTLRTMWMIRLAVISALLVAGLIAAGAAMLIAQDRKIAPAPSAASNKSAPQDREPIKPAADDKNTEMLSVRVVDMKGQGVSNVELKVVERDSVPATDGRGYRTNNYRTGAQGRLRVIVDRRFNQLTFEARPDETTMGWASLRPGDLFPKTTDNDPVTLTLLPRNHQVDGVIVDTRGLPIQGAQVRVDYLNHDANGFAADSRDGDRQLGLAGAVTDRNGHYQLSSLPQDTTLTLAAYHPRFVGPRFKCKPADTRIPSVTLEDAGGIAGTVVDATTGQPIAGAYIGCQRIEHTDRILGGNWGSAISDAQGHFVGGGLAPGVYNVLFELSPKGRRFTARAVEGVRIKAGEDAPVDLRVIAGQRVHGTAVSGKTGKPLVGAPVFCYSASHPRSSAACQGTYTDEEGRFEHFVPPGEALMYIAEPGQLGLEYRRMLDVADDRGPDPIVLRRGDDPNAQRSPREAVIVECEVRVRVKNDTGERPAHGADRALTGRVFDKDGSPVVGVCVYHNDTYINEGATDRLGIFRLNRLPHGPLRLGLRRNHDQHAQSRIPGDAVEVDLIYPE